MAVPAWTAREWRPLARDLYEHVVDKHVSSSTDAAVLESRGSGGQESSKRLLLRADKLVAKLYSHRYMDVTPQQISHEVQELSDKMEIHLLPLRAHRLRELAAGCDYRVVKMLMELAEAPTRASDERVTVDHAVPLEALQAWNRLFTPNKQTQKAAQKARDDAALTAKMEAELLQVAWQDDWWNDRGDGDASEFEDALGDESDALEDEDWMDEQSVPGIASRLLESEGSNRRGEGDEDVEMNDNVEGVGATDAADEYEEGDEEDALLLQYYPLADDAGEEMDTEDAFSRQDGRQELHDESYFSMETPSKLLQFVEAESKRKHSQSLQTSPVEPRRVVQERVFVDAVFYALHGVATPLFEFQQAPCTELFNGDMLVTEITPTALVLRGLAVSHLSPVALRSVTQKVAGAASDLQFLRDFTAFLSASPSEDHRSTTAEGLANEITRQIHFCDRMIESTYQEMCEAAKGSMGNRDSLTHEIDLTAATGSVPLLPTLLGAIGSLKEMFAMLAWLRASVLEWLAPFKDQPRVETSVAHVASELLSSLYRQLQVAFVASTDLAPRCANDEWDQYEILSKLFAGAMVPYLDAIDQLLFQRGYQDRIPLHRELFFVGFDNDRSMPLSPRSTAQRLVEETFEGAMKTLMPFHVDKGAVPSFLQASVKQMSAALESRQIMNQYQSQHSAVTHPEGSKASLSELFYSDFALLLRSRPADDQGRLSPRTTTPFDEVIRLAVVNHINHKCASINGAIADLFRDKLHFREHIEVVRLFLLMHQQDVFTSVGQLLIEQMQLDPVGWARNEILNSALQDAIQRLHTEGLLTSEQREIAARLSIRVDTKELEKLRVTRHIDIMALRHLQFKFTTPQPLRVLFSGSIVHKYSTLAILLLQVKLAELMLTNFRQGFRHRMCFEQTQAPLRSQLVRLADMLHYTRAVLNYLANQMTGDAYSKVERVLATSQSIREINEAHDEYLDKMLNSFFALKKHEGFTRQFLQNFNDIIAFVSRVDEFVRTIERNMDHYFDKANEEDAASNAKAKARTSRRQGLDSRRRSLVANDEFSALVNKLVRQLRNPEANYETQLHVITIVLDAMVKNGASPHVNELLLLLTFNAYRSPSRPRPIPSTPR